jgi:hypothetical protein
MQAEGGVPRFVQGDRLQGLEVQLGPLPVHGLPSCPCAPPEGVLRVSPEDETLPAPGVAGRPRWNPRRTAGIGTERFPACANFAWPRKVVADAEVETEISRARLSLLERGIMLADNERVRAVGAFCGAPAEGWYAPPVGMVAGVAIERDG